MILPSELSHIIAAIDPDAYTTGDATSGILTSDVWDMQNFRSVMAVVAIGDFGTSAALAVLLQESSSSDGTFTSISGKAITALTEAGSDGNKQVIINLFDAEMTYRWARVQSTLTVGALDYGVLVFGFDPRYQDAVTTTAYGDLSSVDEIVT